MYRLVLLFALLGLQTASAADPPLRGLIGVPPEGQLYHGVFPGGRTGEEDDITAADVASYEKLAGKSAAWVYFSHNWYRGREFPLATASWIRSRGSMPFIRLMLRSSPEQNRRERTFRLSRILEGAFDEDLRTWARGARDFGSPLLVEFGTEANGKWFPWNGWWNGRDRGPERFRDAYRHIIRTMRREGAGNILWVFHANHEDNPRTSWNRLENYYPGDDYIDCLGVSVYGALTPLEKEWPEFRPSLDAAYPRLAALSPARPIVVLEFGAAGNNPGGDAAAWAEQAFSDLVRSRWPRVIGFSWWNEAWQNDNDRGHDTSMRLQDNPALAAVFQQWVGGQLKVLGRILPP
ncbi:MAG TPA: glycosyl hydrolase [Anaerolineales bacterium]|nr:glycosyl hydrolase [Anaerolineales bacterium]